MSEVHVTFWDHVEQLRRTLLRIGVVVLLGMVASLVFHKHLFALLEQPIVNLLITGHTQQTHLQGVTITLPHSLVIFSPLEGMTLLFKVSFWVGLVGTSPCWLYMILRFLAPGLTRRERRLLFPFLLLSILFFSLGLLFAYGVTLPIANRFLYELNASMAINLWNLGSYINYSLLLLLAHGLLFETFVVLLFLIHLEVIDSERLAKHRRIAIVTLFAIAALLTPPDVITQCLLALPALALYELMILYGRWCRRRGLAIPITVPHGTAREG